MQKELVHIEPKSPTGDWRDPRVELRKGTICYSAVAKNLNYLGLPNPRSGSRSTTIGSCHPTGSRSFSRA